MILEDILDVPKKILKAQILYQGSTSRRNIINPLPLRPAPGLSVSIRGVSYWLPNQCKRDKLLTFNFGTEKFGVIPHPKLSRARLCTLTNLRGHLGFVNQGVNGLIDIWVWKDNKETWVLRDRISMGGLRNTHLINVIGCLDDEKVLLLLKCNVCSWLERPRESVFTYDRSRDVLERTKGELNLQNDHQIGRGCHTLRGHLITESHISLYSLWHGDRKDGFRKVLGFFKGSRLEGEVENRSSMRRRYYGCGVKVVESLYYSVTEIEREGAFLI